MNVPAPDSHAPSPNGHHELSTVPTVAERLDRLIDIVRRRWLIVISLTALAAVGGILAAGGTRQYSATAKVLLSNSPIVPSAEPVTPSAPGDPEREINTQVGLVKLGTVANRVERRLGLPLSQQALIGKVSATPEGTTNIVDVRATDRSRTRAQAIANAFAVEYVAFRKRVARTALAGALDGIRRQLGSLSAVDLASPQGTALKSRMHQLEILSALQTGGAQVVYRAALPTIPSGPHRLRSGVLGALVGLMLALAVVMVLELRRQRIRDEDLLDSPWISDDAEVKPSPAATRSVDPTP